MSEQVEVAVITWAAKVKDYLAIRVGEGAWRTVAGHTVSNDPAAAGIVIRRRLLVVDPDNSEQVERLASALTSALLNMPGGGCMRANTVQAALRSLTKPPKPDEPLGLGAVVEDDEGLDWHRTRSGRWVAEAGGADGGIPASAGWSHVTAVKVLSEGVS